MARSPCHLVACLDPRPAHSLRKTALFKKFAGRLVHLSFQQSNRPTDCDQNRIRSYKRILTLQPCRTTLSHRQDMLPKFVVEIVRLFECVQLQRPDGLIPFVVLRPRRFSRIDDDYLVVSGEFIQRPFRDIKLSQLLFLGRGGTGRRLDDVLARASRGTDHLSNSLARGIVLEGEVAAAKERLLNTNLKS